MCPNVKKPLRPIPEREKARGAIFLNIFFQKNIRLNKITQKSPTQPDSLKERMAEWGEIFIHFYLLGLNYSMGRGGHK